MVCERSYDIHPICQIIPLMNHDDINRLAEDIVQNGLLEPIVLFEGKILDGRHRYEACARCGVAPRFVDYDGPDPIQFVLSHNIARRHLTPSQLAMVGARIANIKGAGRPAEIGSIEPISIDDAAERTSVGRESVKRARKVIDSGKQDVVEAVDAGKLTVSAAIDILDEPEEVRREIVGSGPTKKMPSGKEPGSLSRILDELQRLWMKANADDRRRFLVFIEKVEGGLDA